MEKIVSSAEANRRLFALLREVQDGTSLVVTLRGKPVARIVSVRNADEVNRGARSVLLKQLRSQAAINIGRSRRDELHEV